MDRLDIKPTGSGQLDGLTFAVKDMFDLVGHISGFGNPDWKKTHSPAVKNAPAVQQLLDAGAHLKATACADELAFSLDGINIHYGTPINPQAPDRIPGGSSSRQHPWWQAARWIFLWELTLPDRAGASQLLWYLRILARLMIIFRRKAFARLGPRSIRLEFLPDLRICLS